MLAALSIFAGALCASYGASAARTEAGPPAELRWVERGDGEMLADAAGMTLYTYKADKDPGRSVCVDACAKGWPPYTAGGTAHAIGDWTVIVRPDGTRQWAYQGKPLYHSLLDDKPGDQNGSAGTYGAWHTVFRPMATPAGIGVRILPIGSVLTDPRGMTLYRRIGGPDERGKAPGSAWQPLAAPAMGVSNGEWSVLEGPAGTRQWAFRGDPLFLHPSDSGPGEATQAAGWEPAIVRAVPKPPHVTVQTSDAGYVYADANGRTLYIHTAGNPLVALVCDDACRAANWQPLLAETRPPELPPGWGIAVGPGGAQQWTFLGKPLYTFNGDARPGDIWGHQFGNVAGGGAPWDIAQPVP